MLNIMKIKVVVGLWSKTVLIRKIYIIWLIGVVLWNFGYPSAKPIEDVLAAIALSYLSVMLKKYLKI